MYYLYSNTTNTSSNEAVRRLIRESDKASVRREIERLIAGETITKEIHQELTYKERKIEGKLFSAYNS